jgi:hypothetical protein
MTRPAIGVTTVFVVLFALLFVYASDQSAPTSKPNPLGERRFIASEEDKLRADLNDPESARFRAEFVSASGGAPMVCGEINYRNNVGGYSGFQRFVAGAAARKTRDQTAAGEFDVLWSKHCSDGRRGHQAAGTP